MFVRETQDSFLPAIRVIRVRPFLLQVTWLKREDDQLLTIGQELYANEARFSASISHSTKVILADDP